MLRIPLHARGTEHEVRRHMRKIEGTELENISGGMKWEGRRQSYNVEDRRPGAPPQWRQTLNTWWSNVRNGYLY